ncbi:unnamed protein product [Pleuronectes platessa]|uniref:Uncharacterized protein n=1 Tax=Pleuronectes platessa TaxID=8262 RepID=A0A9N7VEG4_PLEPL|nr:unnamed protein product [Pleuronectes platessa]
MAEALDYWQKLGLWAEKVSGSSVVRRLGETTKRQAWIDLSKNPRGFSLPCLVPLSKAPYCSLCAVLCLCVCVNNFIKEPLTRSTDCKRAVCGTRTCFSSQGINEKVPRMTMRSHPCGEAVKVKTTSICGFLID